MSRHVDMRRGYTLTELLVVLAIIGVLSSVAVPTFIKAGAFQSHDIADSGRFLYDVLKAAQVYSCSYRVDTAVAYGVTSMTDSVNGDDVFVCDAVCLVRRASDDEIARWAASTEVEAFDSNEEERLFVPVMDNLGSMRLFEEGTCFSVPNLPASGGLDFAACVDNKGFSEIRIRDLDGNVMSPRRDPADIDKFYYHSAGSEPRFPAHIFVPSGYVDAAGGSVERFALEVKPTPDSAAYERYVDDEAVPLEEVPPLVVEVFKSSGRVKIE